MRPREKVPVVLELPRGGDRSEADRLPGGDEFDGNRWNDLHYTNAAKRATVDTEPDGQKRIGSDAA